MLPLPANINNWYYRVPRRLRFVCIVCVLLSLVFLPNRIFYRIFELSLFLFLVLETKNLLYGSALEYILLSTIEVGKNFAYNIVSIPIVYTQFQYIRHYQVAFVFLDTDILLCFLIGLFILYFMRHLRLEKLVICNFDLLYTLFFLMVCISTIFSLNVDNSIMGFLQIIRGALIYFLFRYLPLKRLIYLLPYILCSILLFQSMLGILQYYKKGPVGLIFEIGKYSAPSGVLQTEGLYSFFRPTGTFTEPNLYALVLNMLIPLALLFIIKEKNNKTKKNFFFISFLLGSSAILLSFSRMGWFLYLVNMAALYLFHKKTRAYINTMRTRMFQKIGRKIVFALSLFIIMVISYIVFPRLENIVISVTDTWGSFNARLFLISESIKIISFYPFTGVGLFNFVPILVKITDILPEELYLSSVHNIYLLIASEMGLGTLIAFVLYICTLGREYSISRKSLQIDTQKLTDGLAIALFCFFFGGLFLSYFYAGIQYVFLNVILGLLSNLISDKSAIINHAKKNSVYHHAATFSTRHGR